MRWHEKIEKHIYMNTPPVFISSSILRKVIYSRLTSHAIMTRLYWSKILPPNWSKILPPNVLLAPWYYYQLQYVFLLIVIATCVPWGGYTNNPFICLLFYLWKRLIRHYYQPTWAANNFWLNYLWVFFVVIYNISLINHVCLEKPLCLLVMRFLHWILLCNYSFPFSKNF
jgi:hypothetical protein